MRFGLLAAALISGAPVSAQTSELCEIAIRGAQGRADATEVALEYSASHRRMVRAIGLASEDPEMIEGFAVNAEEQQGELVEDLRDAIGPLGDDLRRLEELCGG